MPIIVETFRQGQLGTLAGKLYSTRAGVQNRQEMYLPFRVSRSRHRGSQAEYRSRSYITGRYNANVVVDEHRRLNRQGLGRPLSAPGLSAGAGSEIQIGYVSFWDDFTQERGPLSKGTSVTGNLTRTWSTLPTVVPEEDVVLEGLVTLASPSATIVATNARFTQLRPGDRLALSSDPVRFGTVVDIIDDNNLLLDAAMTVGAGQTMTARLLPRATHVELWVSVGGATPRFVTRRQLGCTGLIEATATLALGEAYPVTFDRLPRGTINCVFHDRQVVSGDEKHPDTVYLGALGFMERWEGLTVKTRNGAPVTAVLGLRDMILICAADQAMILTGYTEDDIEVTMSEYELGRFAHSCAIMVHGRGWIGNDKGVFLFNGAWQEMTVDRSREWRDTYRRNRLSYENGFFVHNPIDQTVQFHPEIGSGYASQTPDSWIAMYGSMTPEVGGSMSLPLWSNDDQVPETAAYLRDPNTGIGEFYRGRCDGRVYVEDEEEYFHGDGIICPKHLILDDPGGPKYEGKKHKHLWTYIEADVPSGEEEVVDDEVLDVGKWIVEIWPGDEWAGRVGGFVPGGTDPMQEPTPPWKKTHRNGQLVIDTGDPLIGNRIYAPKMVWVDMPSLCAGRGFSMRFILRNCKKWTWRGFGGIIVPGSATRGLRGTYNPV